MQRLDFALVWVALLMAGSACAAGTHAGGAPSTDHNTLTREEFSQRQFNSAFEAIEALRPSWLNRHGPGGIIQIYVDDIHLGGHNRAPLDSIGGCGIDPTSRRYPGDGPIRCGPRGRRHPGPTRPAGR